MFGIREIGEDFQFCFEGEGNEDINRGVLQDYFRLNVNLKELIQDWTKKDKKFGVLSTRYQGLREIRQDPYEVSPSFEL
jgi:hypothetical protein